MAFDRFDLGSTVRLKSGGPVMSVTALIEPDGNELELPYHDLNMDAPLDVACEWFTSDGDRREGRFKLKQLIQLS